MKLVQIKWNDAYMSCGWDTEPPTTVLVKSVGYLIKKTKKKIVLASSKGRFSNKVYLVIPTDWIIKVVLLKKSK